MSTTSKNSIVTLLPVMAVVFTVYAVIGLAMPVLPLYVHSSLHFGTFAVGLVSGSQFVSAMLFRAWAGHYVDKRGPRRALSVGLLLAGCAGLVYFGSYVLLALPLASASVLTAGRVVLGIAESFIITGALGLGLALMGSGQTGKVMSWVGTALYAAYACGAPLGAAVFSHLGFGAIAAVGVALPLVGLGFSRSLPAIPPAHKEGVRSAGVFRHIWLSGFGVALSGVGFGAITIFIVLLYVERHWSPVWLPFTGLSLAFIGGRLLFGHLPDRVGGARVALVCILIEAVGQAFIWKSASPMLTLFGVLLTGMGYSLVYPGFGVEALRSVPAESRGLAMGSYTAFLDLSLGVTGPLLGAVAAHANLNAAFLTSTIVVCFSALIALYLSLAPFNGKLGVGSDAVPAVFEEA